VTPSSSPARVLAEPEPREWRIPPFLSRAERWLRRWTPAAALVSATLLVLGPVLLEVTGLINFNSACDSGQVSCGVATNLVVTFLALALAYFLLFGWKFEKAIWHYRRRVRGDPAALVEGVVRDLGANQAVRGGACRRLANAMNAIGGRSLVVVSGEEGAGKSTFLVGLAHELARRGWLPIPISVGHKKDVDLRRLAREQFLRAIDSKVDTEGAADAIWRRVRWTHSVVVLVDDLDQCEEFDASFQNTRERLDRAVRDVLDNGVALVLATTDEELLAGAVEPIREHLDLLDTERARRYLHCRLGRPDRSGPLDDHLESALRALDDPIEGLRAAPFHLGRIADLEQLDDDEDVAAALRALPASPEAARARLMQIYVGAIERGAIEPDALSVGSSDALLNEQRRMHAIEIASALAMGTMQTGSALIERGSGSVGEAQIEDALILKLLRESHGRLTFPNDSIRVYLIARALRGSDPEPLLRRCRDLQYAPDPRSGRVDPDALTALVFWCVFHCESSPELVYDACVGLLDDLRAAQGPPRAAVVATVARIVAACPCVEDLADEVVELARDATGDNGEKRMLIGALALMDNPNAWRRLWTFAQERAYEVEWAAAKALARGGASAGAAIGDDVRTLLDTAEAEPDRGLLDHCDNTTGFAVGSLAWVIPSLRDGSREWERLFERTCQLCLGELSPLRGELSLVHGIKLAIVDGPQRRDVADTARALLLSEDTPVRFWHARLDLVQVLAIHGWAEEGRARFLRRELHDYLQREEHPLVRATVLLALAALWEAEMRASGWEADDELWSYVWSHESELVGGRPPSNAHLSRLVADVALLNNLTYGLPADELAKNARMLVAKPALPRCLSNSIDRHEMKEACVCDHELCGGDRCLPVTLDRAPFSESFCRQQASLARLLGPPPWMSLRFRERRQARDGLAAFWTEMARAARRARLARA
jgi:NACHT domain